MQNSFRWSLSWLLLPCLVALALLPARFAKADTVFGVSGSATNATAGSLGSCAAGATCSFSGTLKVDVTTGTADAIDITFPGLSAFNTITFSGATIPPPWTINAFNSTLIQEVVLSFTTTPTPASLVGFAGGTIFPGSSAVVNSINGSLFYNNFSGTITPQVTPVPEPSSLELLAAALLAFAGIIRLRNRKPVVTA